MMGFASGTVTISSAHLAPSRFKTDKNFPELSVLLGGVGIDEHDMASSGCCSR